MIDSVTPETQHDINLPKNDDPPIVPNPAIPVTKPILENNTNVQSSRRVIDTPKPRRFKILLIILLVLLILISLSAGLYYFLNKNKQSISIQPNSRLISSQEWRTVIASAHESFTSQNLGPLLEIAIQKNSQPATDVKSYYENVNDTLGVKPQEETAKTTINTSSKLKVQFGLKVSGEKSNSTGGTTEFSGSLAYLMLVDDQSKQSQSDLILNGSFGNLMLNDSDMDALHISIINPSETKSLINLEASDFLLVFLNPDKNQESGGVINVDTDKIYPYFGNYVELNNKAPIETSATNTNISEIDVGALRSAFTDTIGNFNSYLVSDQNLQLTSGPSGLGLIMVNISKVKLGLAISGYFDKVGKFSQQNKDKFLKLCPDGSEDCLHQAGYLSDTDVQNAKAGIVLFLSIFDFDKTGIIVDQNTLEFKGMAVNLRQTVNSVAGKSLPFSNLAMSFSFYTVTPDEKEMVFQPATLIKPDVVPSAISNGTADETNSLYTDNRAYIRALNKGLWEAITSSGSTYCNLYWNPKFCIHRPSDWNISDPESKDGGIDMSYPYGYSNPDRPNIRINILRPGNLQGYNLNTEKDSNGKTPNYRNITTSQGLQLALVSSGESDDYWHGDVCLYSQGMCNNMLPFGMISVSAKGMQFDEIFGKIEPWLKTLTVETEIKPEWTETVTTSLSPEDYPEKKQSVEILPTQVLINDVFNRHKYVGGWEGRYQSRQSLYLYN